MSDWDDLEGVTQPRISSEEAEHLVTGTFSGADETHDLADLSAVFEALRQPAEPAELVGLHAAVAAFGDAVVTMQTDLSTARTRPMIRKLLTGKAIAVIGVVTFVSAGAAAAAGVVPTPFSPSRPSVATGSTHSDEQSDNSGDDNAENDTDVETTTATTTATTAAIVADASMTTKSADETDSTDGKGPDVNGPAKFGLCTAYQARTKHDGTDETSSSSSSSPTEVESSDEPPPFKALSDAADAAGLSVVEFCADATPGRSADAPGQSDENPSAKAPGSSNDNPSATAPGRSHDNPSATAPGRSNDNPSATAPGRSNDNPSATAPGRSNDNPSATAPGQSGGAPGKSGSDHGKPPVTTQP